MKTAPRRRRPHWKDDRGQVAGIEALPFGVLIFVAGALLIANAWAVLDAKGATSAAAREAARAYVEAPDRSSATATAHRRAQEAMVGHGRDPARTKVAIHHDDAVGYVRCARVVIEVSHPVPAVPLPWGGGFGRGFTARSTHSELVDPFRDGLEGDGRCA